MLEPSRPSLALPAPRCNWGSLPVPLGENRRSLLDREAPIQNVSDARAQPPRQPQQHRGAGGGSKSYPSYASRFGCTAEEERIFDSVEAKRRWRRKKRLERQLDQQSSDGTQSARLVASIPSTLSMASTVGSGSSSARAAPRWTVPGKWIDETGKDEVIGPARRYGLGAALGAADRAPRVSVTSLVRLPAVSSKLEPNPQDLQAQQEIVRSVADNGVNGDQVWARASSCEDVGGRAWWGSTAKDTTSRLRKEQERHRQHQRELGVNIATAIASPRNPATPRTRGRDRAVQWSRAGVVTQQHYFLDILERRVYKQLPDREVMPSPLPTNFLTHADIEVERQQSHEEWAQLDRAVENKPLCDARTFLEPGHAISILERINTEHAAIQEKHAIEKEKDLSIAEMKKRRAQRHERSEILRKEKTVKNWKVSMAKPLNDAKPAGYIT